MVSFTATPLSGPRALNVQFNDTSTAAPTSWNWSFGDGATSALKNPQHTYLSTGLYTINHSATNAIGTNWLNSTNYINVTPPRPVADFNGTPTSGTAPLAVQFTDLSTNSPTSWSWSFGDGGVSTQQNLSHTYSSAGRYNVSLTAANAGGSNLTMKTGYVVVTVAANQVTDVAGRSQHQSDIEEVASKQQLMNYNPTSFVKPSSDTIKTRLPNDKIFFFAGHGAPGYILISDTNPISGYYAKNSTDDYNFDDTSSSYSNMKLAVFFGCHTGETDPIIGNLVDIIVAKGGSCAMGWIGDIAADGSYSYNSAFWSSLQNGESIEHAHSEGLYAAEDDPYCKSLISPSSSPELYKYCLFENLYHKGSGWANPLPEGMTNQLVQNLKLAQSEKLSETTKSGIQSKSYLIQDQQSIRKFSSKLDVSPVFERTTHYSYGDLDVFTANNVTYKVNRNTGRIQSQYTHDIDSLSGNNVVTIDEGLLIAEAYAKEKCPMFWENETNKVIKKISQTVKGHELAYIWRQYYLSPNSTFIDSSKITGFNLIDVTLDARDGKIKSYHEWYNSLDKNLNLHPDLSEDQAWEKSKIFAL